MTSRIILLILFLAVPAAARADDSALVPGEFDPAAWTTLVAEYARPDGVAFAAWRAAGTDDLDAFLAAAGAWDPGSTLSKEAKAAWLLNLHAAFAVRQVLGAEPGTSPEDIPGFFDEATLRVGDEDLTLYDLADRLEAQAAILPEVLFAPYTAERGGPPLPDRAYTSGNLDELVQATVQRLFDERGGASWNEETKILTVPPAAERHAEFFDAQRGGMGSVLSRYVTLAALITVSQNPENLHITDIDRSLDASTAGNDE